MADHEQAAKVAILNTDERLRSAIGKHAHREDRDPRRMLLWMFDGEKFLLPAYECLAFDRLMAGNMGPDIGTSVVAIRTVTDSEPPAVAMWQELLSRPSLRFKGPLLISDDGAGFRLGIPPDLEAALFESVKDTKALLSCQAINGPDQYALSVHVSSHPWPDSYQQRAFAMPLPAWRHFWPRNLHLDGKRNGLYTQTGDLGCATARAEAIDETKRWPSCGGMGVACYRIYHAPHRGSRHARGGTVYELENLVSGIQFRTDFTQIIRSSWPDSFAVGRSRQKDDDEATTAESHPEKEIADGSH